MSRVEYDYCHVPTRPPESMSSAIARVSVSEVMKGNKRELQQKFMMSFIYACAMTKEKIGVGHLKTRFQNP